MLFFYGFHFSKEMMIKHLTMLKEKYLRTRGTDDEFEVISILRKNAESLICKDLVGDMPWLVSSASELLYDLGSSSFWYGICTHFLFNFSLPILAFDLDGRLVRKTLCAEYEDSKFPFHAGVLDEEMLSHLSTSRRKDDNSYEDFRYNGRIYR